MRKKLDLQLNIQQVEDHNSLQENEHRSGSDILIFTPLNDFEKELGQLAHGPQNYLNPQLHDVFVNSFTIKENKNWY